MSTWNAVYFKGTLPSGFRPPVHGTCPVRRVSDWVEMALPAVEDGEPTALELSKQVAGEVIWVILQTTASSVAVMHCEAGVQRRFIVSSEGSWSIVEGEPRPWEAWMFSEEELQETREVCAEEEREEMEAAFARKELQAGSPHPCPGEWETLFHVIGVTYEDWSAAQALPPMATLEGTKKSLLTWVSDWVSSRIRNVRTGAR